MHWNPSVLWHAQHLGRCHAEELAEQGTIMDDSLAQLLSVRRRRPAPRVGSGLKRGLSLTDKLRHCGFGAEMPKSHEYVAPLVP
jgi:hypothetical protein